MHGHGDEDAATTTALANLARLTVSMHASRDSAELAGHLEHLAERCLDSQMTLLIVSEQEAGLRVVDGSLRRSSSAEALRNQLGVRRLSENPGLADACRMVTAMGSAKWLGVAELFSAAPSDIAGARCLVQPVSFAGETLAVACMIAPETPQTTALASVLADHAAVAVQRLNAYEIARRLHGVDGGLWIPDEDAVRKALSQELSRARRYGGPVGLTVIRLDCIADLRVRYGKFYTDHLARRVGGHLRSVIRETDSLGTLLEGFAIVHPSANRIGAQIAAERLAESVRQFLASSNPEIEWSPGSISLAAVASPDDGTKADELVAAVRLEIGRAARDESAAA